MQGHALLFTDLVDSTLLVARLGDTRAAQKFAEHDRIARDLLALHRGREIDRSDGFFLLFDEATDAAAFALAYHATLEPLGLKARAGLHVGPVLLRENTLEDVARGAKRLEVEGLAKPLAARVMGLARGGQTLLTASARAAVDAALSASAQLHGHGHYRLKGIAEPLEIFELGPRDAPCFAPPDDTDKVYRVVRAETHWHPVREVRHNLPGERDTFVGRAADLGAIAARLEAGARLLTVLGPAGTGKTRLVRRYGSIWRGDWPGGVYFCDLSDARTTDGVFFVVAVALEVPLGKTDPAAQLGHAIATRGRCLVILDNFEQIVTHAAASVGAWLERASDAVFVVTSRERLHLHGEEVLALEPLAIDSDGVELFALRARAQRPDFALTEANRGIVQRIVTLLDGLPLAIELAAARIRVLSPTQLLDRLADRFPLLSGSRERIDRHATLENAIDWSWNLLAAWEQAALTQCAVFEGGFTLDACEAVLELTAWPGAPAAVDALQALVDKSLLRSWIPIEQQRYDLEEPYFGMYLSIHEYATAKLAACGPAAQGAAEERHARYFARLGSDQALAALHRHGGVTRRRALALELDNLVAASRRAIAHKDGAAAVGALRAAWEVLVTQGPFALLLELGLFLEDADDIAPSLRAAALTSIGQAAMAAGRVREASDSFARALLLAREARDLSREADVLTWTGKAERLHGRMDEARRLLDEALAVHEGMAERSEQRFALMELGIVSRQIGAVDAARSYYERALAIDRAVGDRDSEAKLLNNRAVLHADQGRYDEARIDFEQSLALARDQSDQRQIALALSNLGSLNIELGQLDVAEAQCLSALAIQRDIGERGQEGALLGNLGALHHSCGRVEMARGMYEASLAIAREVGYRRNEGVVLGYLGALERDQGRLVQAREYYDQALAHHRATGNRQFEGAVLGSLGELLSAEGRRDEARALLTSGEALLRELGDNAELGELLCHRGHLELAEGHATRARATLEEAAGTARLLGAGPGSRLARDLDKLHASIAASAAADPTAR